MSDEKENDAKCSDVYVLSILVKSAKDLPDLDFGSKDKTDPVCKVSFQDPITKCSYVWRTSEIHDELNPKWMESNSWPLLFNPPDNLPIRFEVYDVDSFTSADQVGEVTIQLAKIGILSIVFVYIFVYILSYNILCIN